MNRRWVDYVLLAVLVAVVCVVAYRSITQPAMTGFTNKARVIP